MAEKVKLYALSTCIHCKNTKELLDEKNVEYDCVYVDLLKGEDRNKVLNEVKDLNPRLSFPTLVIGDKCIVGFRKEEIEEALKNL